MNRDHSEQHAKQVNAWIAEQDVAKLPAHQQLQLFEAAVQAIQNRISGTLSDITVNAVLDRVLHQSQQMHPLFLKVKFDTNGLCCNDIQNGLSERQGAEIADAFRYFLIELFTILENLTAGIMTKPLYQELSQVSANSMFTKGGEGA